MESNTADKVDKVDKAQLELDWTNKRAAHLPNWNGFSSTNRIYLYEGRGLVYWEGENGAPLILDTLTVRDVGLNFQQGLTVVLDSHKGYQIAITSNPREVLPGVFMWTPAFGNIRFAPIEFHVDKSPRRLTLPLNVKTLTRADRKPMNGVRYLSPVKEFRALWPDLI